MSRQKLYQARLNFRIVYVVAFDLEDAKLCLQEMHPNSNVSSTIEVPMNYFENTHE